jgi:hypothetical protein
MSLSNDYPLYIGTNNTDSIFAKALLEKTDCNIVDYNNQHNTFTYNLYFTDQPDMYVNTIDSIRSHHIHDMVYIRNYPSSNIKKEDRFLIQQKLSKSNIVFRNHQIRTSWFNQIEYNNTYLEYGIPNSNHVEYSDKNSVVIINYQKSNNLNILYYNLKQQISDVDVINSLEDLSYQQICYLLQKYKVCITAGDPYNILCAAVNGCVVFSPETIDGVDSVQIGDFNDIFALLPKYIADYNIDINMIRSQQIMKQYDFNIFTNQFKGIIKHTLRNPVIL